MFYLLPALASPSTSPSQESYESNLSITQTKKWSKSDYIGLAVDIALIFMFALMALLTLCASSSVPMGPFNAFSNLGHWGVIGFSLTATAILLADVGKVICYFCCHKKKNEVSYQSNPKETTHHTRHPNNLNSKNIENHKPKKPEQTKENKRKSKTRKPPQTNPITHSSAIPVPLQNSSSEGTVHRQYPPFYSNSSYPFTNLTSPVSEPTYPTGPISSNITGPILNDVYYTNFNVNPSGASYDVPTVNTSIVPPDTSSSIPLHLSSLPEVVTLPEPNLYFSTHLPSEHNDIPLKTPTLAPVPVVEVPLYTVNANATPEIFVPDAYKNPQEIPLSPMNTLSTASMMSSTPIQPEVGHVVPPVASENLETPLVSEEIASLTSKSISLISRQDLEAVSPPEAPSSEATAQPETIKPVQQQSAVHHKSVLETTTSEFRDKMDDSMMHSSSINKKTEEKPAQKNSFDCSFKEEKSRLKKGLLEELDTIDQDKNLEFIEGRLERRKQIFGPVSFESRKEPITNQELSEIEQNLKKNTTSKNEFLKFILNPPPSPYREIHSEQEPIYYVILFKDLIDTTWENRATGARIWDLIHLCKVFQKHKNAGRLDHNHVIDWHHLAVKSLELVDPKQKLLYLTLIHNLYPEFFESLFAQCIQDEIQNNPDAQAQALFLKLIDPAQAKEMNPALLQRRFCQDAETAKRWLIHLQDLCQQHPNDVYLSELIDSFLINCYQHDLFEHITEVINPEAMRCLILGKDENHSAMLALYCDYLTKKSHRFTIKKIDALQFFIEICNELNSPLKNEIEQKLGSSFLDWFDAQAKHHLGNISIDNFHQLLEVKKSIYSKGYKKLTINEKQTNNYINKIIDKNANNYPTPIPSYYHATTTLDNVDSILNRDCIAFEDKSGEPGAWIANHRLEGLVKPGVNAFEAAKPGNRRIFPYCLSLSANIIKNLTETPKLVGFENGDMWIGIQDREGIKLQLNSEGFSNLCHISTPDNEAKLTKWKLNQKHQNRYSLTILPHSIADTFQKWFREVQKI